MAQSFVASGSEIIQPLVNQCKKLGVKLVTRAKIDGLIFDEEGTVIGAKMLMDHYLGRGVEGTPVNVHSKRGLLIATGGFARNVDLRMVQDPTLTEEVPSTNPASATGEALLEMYRHGAIPVHMAHIQTGPWASPDEDGSGYVSNYSIYNFAHSLSVYFKTGKRFMNEIADRKTRSDAQLACRDDNGKPLPPITITSYKHAKEHPTLKKVLKYGVGWKFETLEELAAHFEVSLEPPNSVSDLGLLNTTFAVESTMRHPFAVSGITPYRRLSVGKPIDLQTAIVVRSMARIVS